MRKHIEKSIKQYREKRSRTGIISDIVFVILIVAMIVPYTRNWMMVGVSKVRAAVIAPSFDSLSYGQLSAADYQWTLQRYKGNTDTLQNHKNKIIFAVFWATWCPHCLAELKYVEQISKQYANNNKLSILCITDEDEPTVQAFMDKHNYTFPVYMSTELPRGLSVTSLPTAYLIDWQGKILMRHEGAADWTKESFVQQLEKSLASIR